MTTNMNTSVQLQRGNYYSFVDDKRNLYVIQLIDLLSFSSTFKIDKILFSIKMPLKIGSIHFIKNSAVKELNDEVKELLMLENFSEFYDNEY